MVSWNTIQKKPHMLLFIVVVVATVSVSAYFLMKAPSSVEGGTTSTIGGTTSTIGGTTSTIGGTTSTIGGTTSTTVGRPVLTTASSTARPIYIPAGYSLFTARPSTQYGVNINTTATLAGNVAALSALCDQTQNCVAFNNKGFMYSAVGAHNTWNPDCNGTYVRNDYSLPANTLPNATSVVQGYKFYKGITSKSNNIIQNKTYQDKIAESITYCDSDPNCLGFSSDGQFKKAIVPPGEWGAFKYTSTNTGAVGLYIKPTYTVDPTT
jgi:hypothetical protein